MLLLPVPITLDQLLADYDKKNMVIPLHSQELFSTQDRISNEKFFI